MKELEKPCHVAAGGLGHISDESLLIRPTISLWFFLSECWNYYKELVIILALDVYTPMKQHGLLHVHCNANSRAAKIFVSLIHG